MAIFEASFLVACPLANRRIRRVLGRCSRDWLKFVDQFYSHHFARSSLTIKSTPAPFYFYPWARRFGGSLDNLSRSGVFCLRVDGLGEEETPLEKIACSFFPSSLDPVPWFSFPFLNQTKCLHSTGLPGLLCSYRQLRAFECPRGDVSFV